MTTAAPVKPVTTTVRGVELVAIGTWNASTGTTRITQAELRAMVDASVNPQYDAPPLKVGHDDDRFQDAAGNPPSTRDGEPAYGWVENLRVSDDGRTLLGDLVGVPQMLADVMDTALRRRSVELVRHDRVGGKTYAAVLTGLALLGVQAPAVKGLADLRALFADQLTQPPEKFSVQIVNDDDTPVVPQTPPPITHGEADTSNKGAQPMATQFKLNSMQRKALGIADDATDAEVSAALKKLGFKLAEEEPPVAVPSPPAAEPPAAPAAPVAATPSPAAEPPAPAPTVVTEPAPAAAEPTPQAVAASAATLGLLVVDQKMYEALSADAAAGRAARDEQDKARRNALVQKAISDGKIAAPAYTAFRAMADTDEDGVITLLAAMPASRTPMAQPIGHAELSADDKTAEAVALDARRKQLADYFGTAAPAAAN